MKNLSVPPLLRRIIIVALFTIALALAGTARADTTRNIRARTIYMEAAAPNLSNWIAFDQSGFDVGVMASLSVVGVQPLVRLGYDRRFIRAETEFAHGMSWNGKWYSRATFRGGWNFHNDYVGRSFFFASVSKYNIAKGLDYGIGLGVDNQIKNSSFYTSLRVIVNFSSNITAQYGISYGF